jgi:hypothetical protein
LDHRVEGNLGAIFALMVVPDDHLVEGRGEDEDHEVGLVHHLDDLDGLVKVLDLLLDLLAGRIVLNDLEARGCGYCEEVLRLVGTNHAHARGALVNVLGHERANWLLGHKTLVSINDHTRADFLVRRRLTRSTLDVRDTFHLLVL